MALHPHCPACPAHHPPGHLPQAMTLVFTHERWDSHRSTLRYVKHLAYLFNSNVFKALLGPVCAVMVISIFVGVYETLLKVGTGGGVLGVCACWSPNMADT